MLVGLLLLFSIGLAPLLQLAFANESWSAFSIFNARPIDGLAEYYARCSVAVLFGFLVPRSFGAVRRERDQSVSPAAVRRALVAARIAGGALLVGVPATQLFLGSSGIRSLLRGETDALAIEAKLAAAPPALFGVTLTAAMLALIAWRTINLGQRESRVSNASLIMAIVYFVGHGKAQGLLFAGAVVTATTQRGSARLLSAVTASLLIFAWFMFTRVLRADGQASDSWTEIAPIIIGGLYAGAPVVNTNELLAGGYFSDPVAVFLLLSGMIPRKFSPSFEGLTNLLPDPTSPPGLPGYALLLGSEERAVLYCVGIGVVASLFDMRSRLSGVFAIFRPWLLVACGTAFMYNHFLSTILFWLPLLMTAMIAAPRAGDALEREA